MFCEECGKKLEDHRFSHSGGNLTLQSLCLSCGRPLSSHRLTCAHCGRGFCGDHAHPLSHDCQQTLMPLGSSRGEAATGAGMDIYMGLTLLGGIVAVVLGFFLVIGNRTGIFPTFPFAGFITMTVGFAIAGYGVNGKF